MEFTLSARNVEINPEIKNYLEGKLGKFNRQLNSIMETRVEVSEEKTRSAQDRILVRVVIKGGGFNIYGEERGENILTATDKIASSIKRQITHQKGKFRGKGTDSIRTEIAPPPAPEKAPGRIIEVKTMEVKPMSLDEALSQSKLMGYDFLLFQNTDTRSINLLKRRSDGNFDLIQSHPG